MRAIEEKKRRLEKAIENQRARNRRYIRNSLMESPSSNGHLRSIPKEIVIEILSRLPVESLLRFKCVSKVWRSSISDPKFTLSSSRRRLRIAFKSCYLYSVHAGEASSSNALLPKPMLFYNITKESTSSYWVKILGLCNGLLLVSHFATSYLWNPTIRQSTKMFSINIELPFEYCFIAESGLCYDPFYDDYKAVMVHVHRGLVTAVSFKRKYANEDDGMILDSGPVANEKLHWVSTRFGNRNIASSPDSRIVYFDPLTDEFVELQMPLVNSNRKHESKIPGVVEGCLCMARCVWGTGDKVEPSYTSDEVEHDYNSEVAPGYNFIDMFKADFIEVLVMKEHGVGESWTSVSIMSDNFGCLLSWHRILWPMCFTKNSEVLYSLNQKRLLAYDLDKMSQRNIHIGWKGEMRRDQEEHQWLKHYADQYTIFYEASYEESLASPIAYGLEEDWIVKGPDVQNFLHCMSHLGYSGHHCYNDGELQRR